MFYLGLEAGNFKELKEMAGLCNICNEYGAENFENLSKYADSLETKWNTNNGVEPNPFSNLKPRIKKFKGYLLSDFQKYLKQHDHCASRCMTWQLGGECAASHDISWKMCLERSDICDDFREGITSLKCDTAKKDL